MPASSFRLCPSFDWSLPTESVPTSAPRPRPTAKARATPRDAKRVAKLLSAKAQPRKHARGRLPQSVLTVLLDRWEVAIADGRLDMIADDGDTPRVEITTGEFALILHILFPEEFPALVAASDATATAPGSKHRIAAYAGRVKRGESLYHRYDACPVRGDVDGRLVAAGKLALAIVQRANGSGPRVLGWA